MYVKYKSKKICDIMLPVTLYQNNINIYHHKMGYDDASLQNPTGTSAHCSQQAVETQVLIRLPTVYAAIT